MTVYLYEHRVTFVVNGEVGLTTCRDQIVFVTDLLISLLLLLLLLLDLGVLVQCLRGFSSHLRSMWNFECRLNMRVLMTEENGRVREVVGDG